MTIRAVIFDLGHTLWDIGSVRELLPSTYAAMRSLLVERLRRDDLPQAAAFQRAMAEVLQAYSADLGRLDEPPPYTWVDAACRKLDLTLDEPLLREVTPPLFAMEIDHLVCGEGTLEAEQALADEGYALGCVTNTLADQGAIGAMLRKHGFEPLMRSVVVSSAEGWRKPHPALFEKALRELSVSAGEALFVGDSPFHDIAGAQRAGLRAVLTRQYASRPLDGTGIVPDAIIGHLSELRDVLARMQRDGSAS